MSSCFSLNLFKLVTYLLRSHAFFDGIDLCDGFLKIFHCQGISTLAIEKSLTFIDPRRILLHLWQGCDHGWSFYTHRLGLFEKCWQLFTIGLIGLSRFVIPGVPALSKLHHKFESTKLFWNVTVAYDIFSLFDNSPCFLVVSFGSKDLSILTCDCFQLAPNFLTILLNIIIACKPCPHFKKLFCQILIELLLLFSVDSLTKLDYIIITEMTAFFFDNF